MPIKHGTSNGTSTMHTLKSHAVLALRSLIALITLIFLITAGLISVPAAANPVRADHIDVELIPATTSVEPGGTLTLALRLAADEHWHTYWKNPGDSGLATQIDWTLPDGFEAGPIQWPSPERIDVGPLANYGYDGEVLLLTDIRVPDHVSGTVPIQANASWLVCEEICIPGDAKLTLMLPTGPAAPDPQWAERIDQTRAALPRVISGLGVRAQLAGGDWVLTLPKSSAPGLRNLAFFPDEEGWIEYASQQKLGVSQDGDVQLQFAAAAGGDRQGQLSGLLVADPGFSGSGSAAIINTAFSVTDALPPAPPPGSRLGLFLALGFAFVGGMILNLMPCVFPVVGIKVLTFVESSRASPASLRAHGLLFALGVLVCFWAIAGVLIALRAGGASLGWGYQLQSPLVVSALALLFFVLALNMSGVFEMGARAQQLAGSVRAESGYLDAFLSGVVATVVATPCTAPFMGAALGFAVTQPAVISMTVFTALALGMAAPYLVLSFSPKLVGRLPKPGHWMVTLKQALAFPLYLTVVWLVWVLGRQVGIDAVARFLIGTTFIAAGLWIYGNWNAASASRARAVAYVFAAVFILSGSVVAWPETSADRNNNLATTKGIWEPWSADSVNVARQEGRAVFVDFTAAWCVTCQVNKRLVLNRESVQTRFRDSNIVLMVADWTNRDPEISLALDSLGRSGVPVYVMYPPGGGDPKLLPELLTESLVLDAIDEVTQSLRTAEAVREE
jgi:DsbC/DsbD-like thiol-disulfide interchange protein/cytochrome c biogenesis protein CcdA